jgi:hypothetical protein
MGNDHLIKFHLIEIVFFDFFQLIKSFIISWPNFLRLFSWSKVFKAQNTIIKTFDQLPKNNLQILAVDQKF